MAEPLLPEPPFDGIHFRTYRGEDDLPAIIEVMRASLRANGEEAGVSVEEMALRLRNREHVDPTEDLVLAFVGEQLVARAFLDWADTPDDTTRHYQSWGDVHPAWRRHGIGTAMWQRNIARLTAFAEDHAFAGQRFLALPYVPDGDRGGAALAARLGYHQSRVYHHMTRATLDDIEVPPLPDGLAIRPITEDLMRTVFDGGVEAFRDHYGVMEGGESDYREWLEHPNTDPALIVAAFEGEEIAGAVHGEIHAAENAEQGYARGWTDPIWVRRSWRRRGLASALLGRALERLRERGMTSAQLDVDSQNPNEAFTLYERHGFVADRIGREWLRALPHGTRA